MIVVFGATGRIGGTAARALRQRGLAVRVVTRRAERAAALARSGCEVASADLRDNAAVERALGGASAALLVCPPRADASDVSSDAQRVIDALGAAIDRVLPPKVVAISDYGAQHRTGTGITRIFNRLEERLRVAPVTTTFLRSAEHMQNWLRYRRSAELHGVIRSLHHPLTKPFPTVSAFDVGSVAADLLTDDGERHRAPRIVHVEGPRRYTALDVARSFESVLKRAVVAEPLPRSDWLAALIGTGMSESYAQLIAELQDAHNAGLIDSEPHVGELRRGTTELVDALACAA